MKQLRQIIVNSQQEKQLNEMGEIPNFLGGDINMNSDSIMGIGGLIIAIFCVIGIILVIPGIYSSFNPEIDVYTCTITDIRSDSLIMENGAVLFTEGIEDYDWIIGETYEIRTEKSKAFMFYETRTFTRITEAKLI